ncbi:hypothetical protein LTR84_007187 [Exophiala bonariae]|uniref:Uncharacterized protein n=1 Tax=Exophiala bonariae TaxID=1690606 RepID=A0AAV9N1D8_9EURO|nr:hypothetical protein LTR84_007187 [Exophiala bonariae]
MSRARPESGDPRLPRSRRTDSFALQNEQKSQPPKLHKGKYNVYNGMTWEKLKGFLRGKFPASKYPGLQFKEERVGDHWVFEIPKPLTKEDMNQLLQLRDPKLARHRSETPE